MVMSSCIIKSTVALGMATGYIYIYCESIYLACTLEQTLRHVNCIVVWGWEWLGGWGDFAHLSEGGGGKGSDFAHNLRSGLWMVQKEERGMHNLTMHF